MDCASCLGDLHVAVADCISNRVCVFCVDGDFIRHVGVGVLMWPRGVAVSAFDDLVVADAGNRRVVVFSSSGEPLKTMGEGRFTGVLVHGGTIIANEHRANAGVHVGGDGTRRRQ